MILRYPGGKKKVAGVLVSLFPQFSEFREPFFGSGAVTFNIAQENHSVPLWINDLDSGIAALWTAVIREPQELAQLVDGFIPSLEAYREFVESLQDGSALTTVVRGFRKLAVHQMSYSGLGLKAGGPIGGWGQDPETNPKKYDIGCRWNPSTLKAKIWKSHALLKGRCREDRCTEYDALELIRKPGEDVFLYLDPPYVGVGQDLYLLGYAEQDHRALAKALTETSHKWALSYDDHPLVRELYREFHVDEKQWAYTINSKKENRGAELLVLSSPDFQTDPMADLW